jgi:hypothetical protein
VQPNEKQRGGAPTQAWKSMRGRDETHAFIVRVHLSIAGDGSAGQSQFSVEDVTAGSIERFATFDVAVESLRRRIYEIVSGPVDDRRSQQP